MFPIVLRRLKAAVAEAKNKGARQSDIARAAGMDPGTLSQILSGRTKASENLDSLFQALGKPRYYAFPLSDQYVRFLDAMRAADPDKYADDYDYHNGKGK